MEKVAAPFLISRFCETASSMAKKRDVSYSYHNFVHHQLQNPVPSDNWNPKSWDWDSVRFAGKPKPLELDTDILRLGILEKSKKEDCSETVIVNDSNTKSKSSNEEEEEEEEEKEEEETLQLNLGGFNVVKYCERPNKRVCSGSSSPAVNAISYPMCQVYNCKEDLSPAKDYHRQHKVCELHSKSSTALVANQLQRFCQQCSRFHPLSEFDEGKRSCRHRLAGHNR